MELLSKDEQHTLHHRYKQNDLYRQWSPILSMLQRKYDEADVETLWYVAEQQIIRLRGEQSFREQEIAPIYSDLLTDCQKFDGTSRTKEQARKTATTVMCVMLTMLMNAVEKGHEDESFNNEPMCLAIIDTLINDAFFQRLMTLFFKRNTGYDGQKVVITPSDPMLVNTLTESMDEVAREETKLMVNAVISHTKGLKALLKDYWNVWEPLWKDILADNQFMLKMKSEEPNGTSWGINQKMVFNVVGMFKARAKLTDAIAKFNDAMSSINRRTYISNHADYGTPNCVFSREQHNTIIQLIDKHLLATKDT